MSTWFMDGPFQKDLVLDSGSSDMGLGVKIKPFEGLGGSSFTGINGLAKR